MLIFFIFIYHNDTSNWIFKNHIREKLLIASAVSHSLFINSPFSLYEFCHYLLIYQIGKAEQFSN